MFPQGWHWPRSGANTIETVIYVQNDVAGYQGDYLAWTAGYYNGHPELAIRMVDTCPAGVNCIVARTQDLAYPTWGLTSVGCCLPTNHVGNVVMRFDPLLGTFGTVYSTRLIFFHEFCHALGGGFTPSGAASIHEFCNWEWRTLIFSEITRVYHDDPG
jgi:hypothetical protein